MCVSVLTGENEMSRKLLVICVAWLAATGQVAETLSDSPLSDSAGIRRATPPQATGPVVQLAILLDNSGSMSGLIDQAKSELWRIVNDLTAAKQDGQRPRLQVAVYTYGDPPPQKRTCLTDDLDRVSEALFAVSIAGGSEHCGQVIDAAVRELDWSRGPNDLKLIFIAGNEPFNQGPIDYREACRSAIAKGIIVNTIHCGSGTPDDWRDGALLADGRAISINQDSQVAYIEAPQDAEISRLGMQLNDTYIPFGKNGVAFAQRQKLQDGNAVQQSAESNLQRAVSKANGNYRNSAWDLVDALREGQVQWENIKIEELPEKLQRMSLEERKQYVSQQSDARTKLQQQINNLNGERTSFLNEKRKEQAAQTGEKRLDQAIVEAVRSQAATKNYVFD